MKLRSLLFVPGDRPDRMEKALGVGRRRADPRPRGCGRAGAPSRRRGGAVAALPRRQQPAARSGCGSIRSTAPRASRDLAAILPAPSRRHRPAQGRGRRLGRRAGPAADRARQRHRPDPRHRHRDAGGDLPARQLWRRQAARRPDLGRRGSARGDRRGDLARGGRALHAALRARPLALPVRRGGGRRGADRDRLSGLPRPRRPRRLCRRGRGATASPA